MGADKTKQAPTWVVFNGPALSYGRNIANPTTIVSISNEGLYCEID